MLQNDVKDMYGFKVLVLSKSCTESSPLRRGQDNVSRTHYLTIGYWGKQVLRRLEETCYLWIFW